MEWKVSENTMYSVMWVCIAIMFCTIIPSMITNCAKYNIADRAAEQAAFEKAVESGMTSEDLAKLFHKQ